MFVCSQHYMTKIYEINRMFNRVIEYPRKYQVPDNEGEKDICLQLFRSR
jgi:hypothetical protein